MTLTPLRVLVVGDPYFDAESLAIGLRSVEGIASLDSCQIHEVAAEPARTESERRLKEYAGSPSLVESHLAGHDVLVVHGAPVSEQVLHSPGLRLVCCARGGPVNVDLEAATRLGIPVTSTPGKNASAVAELTLAFILALIRGIPAAERALREGVAIPRSAFDGREFFGTELAETTLGLVGLGNVGRRVAELARALGMGIIAYDPYVDPRSVSDVDLALLDDVLAGSDVVSLHARASASGAPIMGAREFALMGQGAFFINTAREQLVDEDALVEALDTQHLAGAALDVFDITRDGVHPALIGHPRILVTPHIGGATSTTLARGSDMVAEAIAALARGATLPYLVNPDYRPRHGTESGEPS
jgi:D-3-phosphoglycerate dehydrogenase